MATVGSLEHRESQGRAIREALARKKAAGWVSTSRRSTGKTWKVNNRISPGCSKGCTCKRHTPVLNSSHFQSGKPAGPGWAKNIGRGWTDEDRVKSGRMTGKKHTPEARAKIKAYLHERYGPDCKGRLYPLEWGEVAQQVRRRDKFRCRICRQREKLHVHHLDYDKQNLDLANLITLCDSCHMSGHGRQVWPINLRQLINPATK